MKKMLFLACLLTPLVSVADEAEIIQNAEQIFEATRIVCSGISDEIAKIANMSKANTAVTTVGTVAAGGALATGIMKSKTEQKIDALISEMCAKGGCNAETVKNMSGEEFYNTVILTFEKVAELQKEVEKSKTLGNWRTGLMAGTVGTNLASAILSGLNIDQSDLIQHISACNEMVKQASNAELDLKAIGVGPNDSEVVKKLSNAKTWCSEIQIADVEKIEKRMKGVLGTSVAGTAIGAVGVGTSAAANSDKYIYNNVHNKIMTDKEKRTEHALNTTANVMAGANIATGAVETGLNISLITLTKKLIDQAKRCEEVLQ